MKNIYTCLIVFCVLNSLFSCKKKDSDDKFSYSIDGEVVEIPFNTKNSLITSELVIGNDTIPCIVDTGALSFLTFKSSVFKLDRKKEQIISDFYLNTSKVFQEKVDSLQWKNLFLKNTSFIYYDSRGANVNLIGNNILTNFCIKIDNKEGKFILASNSNHIEKKGFKIPFELKNGYIYLTVNFYDKENNTLSPNVELMLDTGHSGEIHINENIKKIVKSYLVNKVTWMNYEQSVFSNNKEKEEDYFLSNLKVGEHTFQNILTSSVKNSSAILGLNFIKRFSSVTIDYPNKTIYFEPINHIENFEYETYLTKKTNIKNIEFIPLYNSLYNLYEKYNSFGIIFNMNTYPYIVSEKVKDSMNEFINLGDTLVGINNTFFTKESFKLSIKENLKNTILEEDAEKQIRVYYDDYFGKSNEVDYHFLKNGKLITLRRKRINLSPITTSPILGYSFINEGPMYPHIFMGTEGIFYYSVLKDFDFPEKVIQVKDL